MNNKNFETISFRAKDGLLITADYYRVEKPKETMVLCHRSHCNRGEYRETAPKLNRLGYSCLAIDQRSGMNVFGVVNETKKRAKSQGLPTGYLDVKPDIEAAVEYAYKLNGQKSIILLGSSYSAALCLLIARETDKVKAVVGFSPGEYLKGIHLAQEMASLNKPVFLTSPKAEIGQVKALIEYIDKKNVTHFKPEVEGFHGSKALWEKVPGNETYWLALERFLTLIP